MSRSSLKNIADELSSSEDDDNNYDDEGYDEYDDEENDSKALKKLSQSSPGRLRSSKKAMKHFPYPSMKLLMFCVNHRIKAYLVVYLQRLKLVIAEPWVKVEGKKNNQKRTIEKN